MDVLAPEEPLSEPREERPVLDSVLALVKTLPLSCEEYLSLDGVLAPVKTLLEPDSDKELLVLEGLVPPNPSSCRNHKFT